MTNALAPLLALILAVTPTVEVVCRALCTPQLPGAAAHSCHEAANPATADGVLLPATACHHDAVEAIDQVKGARNRLAPALHGTVQVTVFAYLPSPDGGGRQRQSLRPRLPHAYPSPVVLRI